MILHVVLYRPRPDLPDDDRRAFAEAVGRARSVVSSIRQFWVGRRIADGPTYLLGGFPEFPFAAIAAFDDRAGLLEYLQHPAHAEVGRWFNGTAEAALIYDFEVADPSGDDAKTTERLLDLGSR